MAAMLPTIIRNLLSRPETRMYPTEIRKLWPGARGHIEFEAEKCIFCSLCSKRCPSGAISVDRENREWTLDPYRCIVCGTCIEGCPKGAIELVEQWRAPAFVKNVEAYQAPHIE
jgi:Formate hydrogenlyase subunit 6/NADH:ubiquinone oxidoreductase 23 kD subunit (chain I)